MSTERIRPWVHLAELVEAGDTVRLAAFIDALEPGERARAVANLPSDLAHRLLTVLGPEGAADLIDDIPDQHAGQLMERLPAPAAAAIVHELPSDERVDLLEQMDDEHAEAVLAELEPDEARDVRQLAHYEPDQAGGLMVTEVVSFTEDTTVRDVLADLEHNAERYARYQVQYMYVTTLDRRLLGVIRLRDLVLTDRETRLRELMIPEPLSVLVSASLEDLDALFDEYGFYGVPVVDARGTLLGLVQQTDLAQAIEERAQQDHMKARGIVSEELRTMPTVTRAGRRLSWLSVNVLLNVVAASVIAYYQDTLTAVIALAVFLPMLSDMSGCSGNQAVAVSLRELTLGLIRPADAVRVWLKEISVGALNGLVLGALLGLAAWLWKGNPFLGLVVGGAMALNTMVAVSVGGLVPLVLRKLRMDPALASGPILTTVTDMCGFLLLLGLATAFLPLLV